MCFVKRAAFHGCLHLCSSGERRATLDVACSLLIYLEIELLNRLQGLEDSTEYRVLMMLSLRLGEYGVDRISRGIDQCRP